MLKKSIFALSFVAAMIASQPAMADDKVKTVFVIAMENHNWTQPSTYTSLQQVFGNPAAPYINSLVTPGNANAAQVSYASNYLNVINSSNVSVHPSEPNYVWAEAGVNGPLNDNTPYPSNIVNAPSLGALLQSSGQTWKSYQEDIDHALNGSGKLTNTVLPQNQWTVPLNNLSGTSTDYTNPYNGSHQYDYAAKHNPDVFFNATNGGNNSSPSNPFSLDYAPLDQLAADLASNNVAQYNWITPDQFNDMHTGLSGGFNYNGQQLTGDAAKIAQGDNFLSKIIPLIMASQAYQDNGAIVIWNDEAEGETLATHSQFTSMEIVISPLAKGNAYNSTIGYDHSSDLLSMQEVFGLTGTPLGGAATATDLSDLFKPGALTGSVPEPATWAMMLAGFAAVGSAIRRRKERAVSFA